MMTEDYLLNYGVLGLWTASLLVKEYKFNRKLLKAINDLTLVITKHL